MVLGSILTFRSKRMVSTPPDRVASACALGSSAKRMRPKPLPADAVTESAKAGAANMPDTTAAAPIHLQHALRAQGPNMATCRDLGLKLSGRYRSARSWPVGILLQVVWP